jgi:hypothetical protein
MSCCMYFYLLGICDPICRRREGYSARVYKLCESSVVFNTCPSPYLVTCGEHSQGATCTLLPVKQGRDDKLKGTRLRTIVSSQPNKMPVGCKTIFKGCKCLTHF